MSECRVRCSHHRVHLYFIQHAPFICLDKRHHSAAALRHQHFTCLTNQWHCSTHFPKRWKLQTTSLSFLQVLVAVVCFIGCGTDLAPCWVRSISKQELESSGFNDRVSRLSRALSRPSIPPLAWGLESCSQDTILHHSRPCFPHHPLWRPPTSNHYPYLSTRIIQMVSDWL